MPALRLRNFICFWDYFGEIVSIIMSQKAPGLNGLASLPALCLSHGKETGKLTTETSYRDKIQRRV